MLRRIHPLKSVVCGTVHASILAAFLTNEFSLQIYRSQILQIRLEGEQSCFHLCTSVTIGTTLY